MYKIKQMLAGLVFALFTGLATMSGTAIALTADDETPANEGVCDALQGGTGGLYGLCVAYCEAQDLDAFEVEPPRSKILENYNRKKQTGDPDMPCMQIPCPCWSAEELAAISEDGVAQCTPGTDKLNITNTTIGHERNEAEATTTAGRGRCRFLDFTDPRLIRAFRITDEQSQACFTQIEQACVGF